MEKTLDKRQQGGIAVLIGNAALFANGLIASLKAPTLQSRQAGIARMSSAVLWSGSGLLITKYGHRDVDKQLTRLEEKLSDHLRRQGVPLNAETLRLADAHTRHGWFHHLEDFLYNHPIEVQNAYVALATAGFTVSGLLRRRDGHKAEGNANLAVSGLILIRTLASILIPEKTDAQIAADGQTGTVVGAIEKKPLAAIQWIALTDHGISGVAALGEMRSAQKLATTDAFRPWQQGMAGFSAAAMAAFISSDFLTGSASKKASGTPEEHEAAQAKLLHHAATVLAALPPEQQQTLAADTASYLTKQPELRLHDRDAGEVTQAILTEAQAMAKSAPACGTHAEKLAQAHAFNSTLARP